VNPSLYKELPYNAERDFTPVTRGVMAPMAMVVHPSVPARTLAELVALGKTAPGKLAYGSAGTGSPTFLGVRISGGGTRPRGARRHAGADRAAHRRRDRPRDALQAGGGKARGAGAGAGLRHARAVRRQPQEGARRLGGLHPPQRHPAGSVIKSHVERGAHFRGIEKRCSNVGRTIRGSAYRRRAGG